MRLIPHRTTLHADVEGGYLIVIGIPPLPSTVPSFAQRLEQVEIAERHRV